MGGAGGWKAYDWIQKWGFFRKQRRRRRRRLKEGTNNSDDFSCFEKPLDMEIVFHSAIMEDQRIDHGIPSFITIEAPPVRKSNSHVAVDEPDFEVEIPYRPKDITPHHYQQKYIRDPVQRSPSSIHDHDDGGSHHDGDKSDHDDDDNNNIHHDDNEFSSTSHDDDTTVARSSRSLRLAPSSKLDPSSSNFPTARNLYSPHQDEPTITRQGEPTITHQNEPNIFHQDEPTITRQGEPTITHQDEPNIFHQDEPTITHQGEPTITHQDEPNITNQDEPNITAVDIKEMEQHSSSPSSIQADSNSFRLQPSKVHELDDAPRFLTPVLPVEAKPDITDSNSQNPSNNNNYDGDDDAVPRPTPPPSPPPSPPPPSPPTPEIPAEPTSQSATEMEKQREHVDTERGIHRGDPDSDGPDVDEDENEPPYPSTTLEKAEEQEDRLPLPTLSHPVVQEKMQDQPVTNLFSSHAVASIDSSRKPDDDSMTKPTSVLGRVSKLEQRIALFDHGTPRGGTSDRHRSKDLVLAPTVPMRRESMSQIKAQEISLLGPSLPQQDLEQQKQEDEALAYLPKKEGEQEQMQAAPLLPNRRASVFEETPGDGSVADESTSSSSLLEDDIYSEGSSSMDEPVQTTPSSEFEGRLSSVKQEIVGQPSSDGKTPNLQSLDPPQNARQDRDSIASNRHAIHDTDTTSATSDSESKSEPASSAQADKLDAISRELCNSDHTSFIDGSLSEDDTTKMGTANERKDIPPPPAAGEEGKDVHNSDQSGTDHYLSASGSFETHDFSLQQDGEDTSSFQSSEGYEEAETISSSTFEDDMKNTDNIPPKTAEDHSLENEVQTPDSSSPTPLQDKDNWRSRAATNTAPERSPRPPIRMASSLVEPYLLSGQDKSQMNRSGGVESDQSSRILGDDWMNSNCLTTSTNSLSIHSPPTMPTRAESVRSFDEEDLQDGSDVNRSSGGPPSPIAVPSLLTLQPSSHDDSNSTLFVGVDNEDDNSEDSHDQLLLPGAQRYSVNITHAGAPALPQRAASHLNIISRDDMKGKTTTSDITDEKGAHASSGTLSSAVTKDTEAETAKSDDQDAASFPPGVLVTSMMLQRDEGRLPSDSSLFDT